MSKDLRDRFDFCQEVFHHHAKFPHLTRKEAFESILSHWRIGRRPLPFKGVKGRAYNAFMSFAYRNFPTETRKPKRSK